MVIKPLKILNFKTSFVVGIYYSLERDIFTEIAVSNCRNANVKSFRSLRVDLQSLIDF